MFSKIKAEFNLGKNIFTISFLAIGLFVMSLPTLANEKTNEANSVLDIYEEVLLSQQGNQQESKLSAQKNIISPDRLGPVIGERSQSSTVLSSQLTKDLSVSSTQPISLGQSILESNSPWVPAIVPFLDSLSNEPSCENISR